MYRLQPPISPVTGQDSRRLHFGPAFLGAVGWALTAWTPSIGPIIALILWVGVIYWRYPRGWTEAAIIGVTAWISALVVLSVVNSVSDSESARSVSLACRDVKMDSDSR